MAAVSSVLARDVLSQFDQELAELLEHVETVVGSSDLLAVTGLRRRFDRLDGIASAVRVRVTGYLASSAFEWSDQIVQTRTLVVLADLAMLCDAAEELPSGARLFGDAFPGVDALFAYVVRGIERIPAGLEHERRLAQCAESPGARTALTEVAFGKAACGLAAIGRDERLVRALRAGARMPSLWFGVACRALLVSLGSPGDAADLIRPPSGLPPHARGTLVTVRCHPTGEDCRCSEMRQPAAQDVPGLGRSIEIREGEQRLDVRCAVAPHARTHELGRK